MDASVPVLLAHAASLTVRDREFHAQPLVLAAEGSRGSRDGRDYAAVGRLLLDAASWVKWAPGDEPSEVVLDVIAEQRWGQVSSVQSISRRNNPRYRPLFEPEIMNTPSPR